MSTAAARTHGKEQQSERDHRDWPGAESRDRCLLILLIELDLYRNLEAAEDAFRPVKEIVSMSGRSELRTNCTIAALAEQTVIPAVRLRTVVVEFLRFFNFIIHFNFLQRV
jgi:hypothetical protein